MSGYSLSQRVTRRVLASLLAAGLVLAGGAPPATAVTSADPLSTIAGTGLPEFGGDGGPALEASLYQPRDTALGPDGSLYVTDTFNNRVRRIAPDGTIETIAGNGVQGFSGDGGPATEASLSWPHDVFVSPGGIVYITDSNNHRIRQVDLDGIITTIAGTGVAGTSGDGGPAVEARLRNPKSVIGVGSYLYITGLDDKIRRIDLTTGLLARIAGTGIAGYSGDGGPAALAKLDGPQRLQIDAEGNLYVADTFNDAVRRVDAQTGTITTIAGTPQVSGFGGDGGPATQALLNTPRGIALEGSSTLYVADTSNHRIRKVNLRTGIITTISGGPRGDVGDGGTAWSGRFYQPRGLTVTPHGDLVIADTFNNRVRKITAPPPDNAPPVPVVAVSCTQLECRLDARGSTDLDGTITGVDWAFEDGATDTGAVTLRDYTATGTERVTVTVTDNGGATASSTVSVSADTETGVASAVPVARIGLTCAGQTCSVDGATSTDLDGSVTRWDWTFGDGATASGPTATHRFADEGPQEIRLRVLDNAGVADTVIRTVDVQVPNVAPVASLVVRCTLLSCAMDASASTDPDGTVAAYAWTFGDGASGTGATVSHEYGTPGTYTVTLRVTDAEGASTTVTRPAQTTLPSTVGFVSSTARAGSSSRPTIGLPPGLLAGHTLVYSLSYNSGTVTAQDPTGITGWTRIGTTVVEGMTTIVWTRTAGAAEAGRPVPVQLSGTTKFTSVVAAYAGIGDGPFTFIAGGEPTFRAPRVTPAAPAPAGAWVVSSWSDLSSSTTAWTLPGSVRGRAQVCAATTARVCTALADRGPVVAGTSPGVSASTNAPSGTATMWTLVLPAR